MAFAAGSAAHLGRLEARAGALSGDRQFGTRLRPGQLSDSAARSRL